MPSAMAAPTAIAVATQTRRFFGSVASCLSGAVSGDVTGDIACAVSFRVLPLLPALRRLPANGSPPQHCDRQRPTRRFLCAIRHHWRACRQVGREGD